MIVRSLGRLTALLSGALFAEAVRVDPSQPRRNRRSSRRIVKSAQHASLADWFPAANAPGIRPAFSASGASG